MKNLVHFIFPAHPLHLISPFLLPLYTSISLLVLTSYPAMRKNKALSIETVFAIFNSFFKNNADNIPKPYKFTTNSMESNVEFTQILTDLGAYLPQLGQFIIQFNDVVTRNGINVITDSVGNMSMDVPSEMSDALANNLSKRLGIIDRLITQRGQEINELLLKGLELEKNLKLENPDYVSPLTEKINEFKRLNSIYKH
uniref:cytochrome c oxidase subunit 1 n=1 Tax=Pyricularia oryzae TaxID=318829 RepID=UPI0021B673F5|nr:cytochrome c oxidase subunit 1 [Pyricularia oryzae]